MIFSVSHPYMTPTVEGELPRSTHQEIFEEEQVMADHVVDVLHACQRNVVKG